MGRLESVDSSDLFWLFAMSSTAASSILATCPKLRVETASTQTGPFKVFRRANTLSNVGEDWYRGQLLNYGDVNTKRQRGPKYSN
eukprot:g64181.t1